MAKKKIVIPLKMPIFEYGGGLEKGKTFFQDHGWRLIAVCGHHVSKSTIRLHLNGNKLLRRQFRRKTFSPNHRFKCLEFNFEWIWVLWSEETKTAFWQH